MINKIDSTDEVMENQFRDFDDEDLNFAAQMIEKLDRKPFLKEKDIDPTAWGFVALGYSNDTSFVWSNFKNCLFTFTPKDFSKSYFYNAFGPDFIEVEYEDTKTIHGKEGKSREVSFINLDRLRDDIINKCRNAGLYTADKNKGRGVYLTKANEIVVNTEEVFSTDEKFDGSRIQKEATYIYKGSLGIDKTSPLATIKEIQTFRELIKVFKYSNAQNDSLLMTGWVAQGFLVGALEWVAHVYLFGEAGSGKTTKMKMIKGLLGQNSHYFDGGSSEAGIRQKVGINTGVVQIDETEPDRQRVDSHLSMFRGASSGTTIARGTTNQTGTEYVVKFAGMLAGVIPVELRQADKGRFLEIKLLTLQKEDKTRLTDEMKILMNDIDELNILGQKVQMYLIKNFKEVMAVSKKVREKLILKNAARLADTYSTIIALSYVLHCGEYKDINSFIDLFELDEKSQDYSEAKDHDELLEILMTREIGDEDGKNRMSIINYIYNAHHKYNLDKHNDFKAFNGTLGKYGIRVLDTSRLEILIDPQRGALKTLLDKSRFQGGNIREVLLRLADVEIINDNKMIGGVQKRKCIKLVLDNTKYNYSKFAELSGDTQKAEVKPYLAPKPEVVAPYIAPAEIERLKADRGPIMSNTELEMIKEVIDVAKANNARRKNPDVNLPVVVAKLENVVANPKLRLGKRK